MEKNTIVFREAIKALNAKGIINNTIAKEMGIVKLQFNRYYMGNRIPSADIVNGIIIRYGLPIELLEEEIVVTEEPVVEHKEEIEPKKQPENNIDLNDFLKKFNSLSDYNKKTIIDMVDSLSMIQNFDKTKEESPNLKHDTLGLKLKK